MVKGKRYDFEKWQNVRNRLYQKIDRVGDDHKKAPSQLKFLRERFENSIRCYNEMF